MIFVNKDKFWKKVKSKDEQSFSRLYDFYYPLLFSRALKFIDSKEDCKEILQETFILFWENVSNINPKKYYMEAYLWKILRSQIARFYRDRKVIKLSLEDSNLSNSLTEELPLDNFDKDNYLTELRLAIDALPKRRKQVFLMSRFEGLSYAEISRELDISIKTVEYHISAALNTMRSKIKKK